jgi:tetraacyldisaccharide 4'-kinase
MKPNPAGRSLAATFGLLAAARNRGFDRGWLPITHLAAPVISVGNLSVGGTGKTPTVIAVGEELARRGLRCDVLTRGYRRPGRERLVVLPPAPAGAAAPAEAGDEPRLIARRLQVPVLVGRDRAAGGREGERRFASQLHLLDDGFQRRQLGRCFDLVLVTAEDLEDHLLPAGRLREPPRALVRAHAVLWAGHLGDSVAQGDGVAQDDVRRRVARWTAAPVYFGHKAPSAGVPVRGRVFAFCALGRPESFWATLEEMGMEVAGRRSFRDHYRYRRADILCLRREAADAGAETFVTTEKDAINLPDNCGLEKLTVIGIEMRITALPQLVDMMLAAAGWPAGGNRVSPG